MTDWWNNPNDVLDLARHLNEKGTFTKPSEVLDFFEKPWKWESEWNTLMQEDEQKRQETAI